MAVNPSVSTYTPYQQLLTDNFNFYSHIINERNLHHFPIYTLQGKWQKGRHWSNGFVIGNYLLLSAILQKSIDKPALLYCFNELEQHKQAADFQDIGFIAHYSQAVFYNLQTPADKEKLYPHVHYLQQCLTPEYAFIVNWKPAGYISVDQFMNSMFLGWYALAYDDQQLFSCYAKVIDHAIKKLIVNGIAYEYCDSYGRFANTNAQTNDRLWLRGQAWAIVGLAYAAYLFKKMSLDNHFIIQTLLSLLDPLLAAIEVFNDLPATYCLNYLTGDTLQDSSAEAAIVTALLFLKNRHIVLTEKSQYLIDYLAKRIFPLLGVKKNILTQVSYPKRIISQPGESAVWGDYFALRFLMEFNHGETESRFNII